MTTLPENATCDFCHASLGDDAEFFDTDDFDTLYVFDQMSGTMYLLPCTCHCRLPFLISRNVHRVQVQRNVGGFASCPECAALVRAEDRDGLLRRAYEKMSKAFPALAASADSRLLDGLKSAQTGFWTHYPKGANPAPIND